jgi:hypothetical protein
MPLVRFSYICPVCNFCFVVALIENQPGIVRDLPAVAMPNSDQNDEVSDTTGGDRIAIAD